MVRWLAGATLAAGAAHAQAPRVGLPAPGSPLPGVAVPPAQGAPPPPSPEQGGGPAPAPAESFNITGVTIIGNTAFSSRDLAAPIAGLTGPAVPLQAIEQARFAILRRYQQAGYVYATVRAHIHGTALRFNVAEPHVVDVKLARDIGPVGNLVLRFLNHLADSRLLGIADYEYWVLLANDIPGVAVRVRLDFHPDNPGAATLVADAVRKPVDASINIDNRADPEIGPEELLAVAHLNSFTSLGDRTELSFYHTSHNTENFGQAAEEFYIGGSGLKLRLYFGEGETVPSGVLRALSYDGITRVFGAKLSYPLLLSRTGRLDLNAQFDAVESDIHYGTSRESFDSLRVLRASADYALQDNVLGPSMDGRTQLRVELSQGLPAFGAEPNQSLELPRAAERVDFTKLVASADRLQTLFSPYRFADQDAEVRLHLAAAGQFSRNILPPEEQFYLGGPDAYGGYFNPGYYYGEATGDNGLTAKIEPELYTPLPRLGRESLTPYSTFYTFASWGETWQMQKLDAAYTLRSVGGGARFDVPYGDHRFEIDLEGVSRLTRALNGGAALSSAAFYWKIVGEF